MIKTLNFFVKKTIYLNNILTQFLSEKYLRILLRSYMILAPVVIGVWGNPHFAFSQKEAALEELDETAFNFHEVAQGVYRSGLISERAAPSLKELGIKTVISFDNNLKRVEREEKFLRRSGINLISIPWSGWDDPKDETIAQILNLMESPERKPVLVHCKHGQERTGVVVACWRIAHQGWSAEKAYREMKAHGFRPFQYGHLKRYVYSFAREHGDESAEIKNSMEQTKTNVLSFFYHLRKWNPFYNAHLGKHEEASKI